MAGPNFFVFLVPFRKGLWYPPFRKKRERTGHPSFILCRERVGHPPMNKRTDARELVERIRTCFPELEEGYRTEENQWKDKSVPSNYDIVGFVFKPRFKEEFKNGILNDFLRRSAKFMEEVCASGDTEAVNVIWVEIFEWLIYHRDELELIWPALGPRTRDCIRDAARRWSTAARDSGHKENLPENNIPPETE